MPRKVTRARLRLACLGLQTAMFATTERKTRRRIADGLRLMEQIGSDMRREAIFAAGARARKPEPVFEGQQLGSAEAYTFYDGYASKHAAFINPYRGRR